jgi:hypothetical protein
MALLWGPSICSTKEKFPHLNETDPLRHTRGVGDEQEVLRKPLDSKTSSRETLGEMPPTLQAPIKKAKPNKKS